jgi:predicted DNA-binding protein (UPF0251 family)
MGSGSNTHSNAEVIENSYLKDSYGVERLLSEVFQIVEKSRYQFDESAYVLIADLENALDCVLLSGQERQVIALTYYGQLNTRQVSKLIGIKTFEVIDLTAEAIEKIAAILMGYKTTKLAKYQPPANNLIDWLEGVGVGTQAIYYLPTAVNTELLEWLAEHGDELSEETLRQRVEGPPVFVDDRPEAEQYPCYTWDQLRDMDRKLKVSLTDNKGFERIARGRSVVGSRKVSYHDKNGAPQVVNAKIYK